MRAGKVARGNTEQMNDNGNLTHDYNAQVPRAKATPRKKKESRGKLMLNYLAWPLWIT